MLSILQCHLESIDLVFLCPCLFFCLVVLSIFENGISKSSIITVDFSISLFSSARFSHTLKLSCLVYQDTFRMGIYIYLVGLALFYHYIVSLSVYDNFCCSEIFLMLCWYSQYCFFIISHTPYLYCFQYSKGKEKGECFLETFIAIWYLLQHPNVSSVYLLRELSIE